MVIATTLVGIVLVFVGVFRNANNDIDTPSADGRGTDTSIRQAIIKNGDQLVAEVRDIETLDNISRQLYDFSRISYEKYAMTEYPYVGFEIANTSRKDDQIEVTGRFGAENEEIQVNIKLLKNNQINISITNKNTGLNVDNFLKANSTENQFIGSLPIETSGYTIDYLPGSNTYTVNVFNDVTNFSKAQELLENRLGDAYEPDSVIRYGVNDTDYDFGF